MSSPEAAKAAHDRIEEASLALEDARRVANEHSLEDARRIRDAAAALAEATNAAPDLRARARIHAQSVADLNASLVRRREEMLEETGATLSRLIDVGFNDGDGTLVLHLTDGHEHTVYVTVNADSMRLAPWEAK